MREQMEDKLSIRALAILTLCLISKISFCRLLSLLLGSFYLLFFCFCIEIVPGNISRQINNNNNNN